MTQPLTPALDAKLGRLEAAFRSRKGVLVALSGGVDSTLCMEIAHRVLGPARALAVTARSETLTDAEYGSICALAAERGWNHRVIEYSELDIPNYAENPINRCFFCKHELYTRLAVIAEAEGLDCVVEGTNYDDRGDYRPGMKAAAQIGTFAPLYVCEVTKEEVRALAHHFGLPNYDKPSGACLSSRFPYGTRITREGLDRVAAAEACLHELGFRQVRVRHHEHLARIEVPPAEIARFFEENLVASVAARFREIGFIYVTLDLTGYRTGSMNETLRAAGVVT